MKKRYPKAFTLTELILAAAILAFVLGGLLLLFINCLFLNAANRNLSVAMTHAQYALEQIRNSGFTGLESEITGGDWDWDGAEIASYNLVPLPNETIDTGIFQSSNPLGVTVRVDWKDRGLRDRSVMLQTLITDY